MNPRTTVVAFLMAGLTSLAIAAPAQFEGRTGLREIEAAREDSPSIAAFVAARRADLERAPSPSRSLQDAIERVVPDLDRFPRCLTPVTLSITKETAQSPEFASSVAHMLVPPTLSREMLVTTPDGHFNIHYTLDRANGNGVLGADHDANGSPDYVDQVSAALVASRQKIVVKLGYRDPQTEGPIDVYMANLGGRVDGYTMPSDPEGQAFLVIDSRLLGNDALLRAAVAHQYAHAVLGSYGTGTPIWWAEASAAWLEGTVIGSYAHYTDQLQTSLDASEAGLGNDDARFLQGRLLWPAYLSNLGPRGGIVREVWENLESLGDAADVWQATDMSLRPLGMSLEQAFSDYSLWLLLSGGRNDGQHFPFAERLDGVSYAGQFAAYPAGSAQTNPKLSSFGASFVRFESGGRDGGLRLSLEGDSPGQFQAQILLTPRKEGAALVRAFIAVDARGHGAIAIPWATFSEAVLIVGNVMRGGADAGYTFTATPDPHFPFEMTSFSADAEEGDVRVTWETQAEDGLYGWIVYRSELSGAAGRRINELIVPAIGDGDGPVAYQYLDDGVNAGRTYYYRLVGVTHDGLMREVPETRVDLPR